jgi:hypothetical protein
VSIRIVTSKRKRKVLKRQIDRRRENYRQLRSRVQLQGRITPEDQAIRMLLTIPEYRTAPRSRASSMSRSSASAR